MDPHSGTLALNSTGIFQIFLLAPENVEFYEVVGANYLRNSRYDYFQ
jgi:hypothetical protein